MYNEHWPVTPPNLFCWIGTQVSLSFKGIIYSRDVVKGTCVKGPAPPNFPTIEVPINATYIGRIYFGKSFFLDSWTAKVGGKPLM
jgi:hypothetical protein